ncbi:hypothetical protein [Bryobacter aggregatus]|uniref:hypothetical protein n=1 Tax=Bryobacter aggregatus TaxID=360054 RepID=UPI0004E16D40|nr:hypothetical protein [Bryobacter aggregatus]
MSEPKKPVVRLDPVKPPRRVVKKVMPAQDPIIKLAIRLNEGVNEALRTLIRYRGDLSVMAIEALQSIDLASVALVSVEEKMVRDTTISLPRPLHKKIKKIAEDRGSSMNIIVNTGLAYWLASKGSLSLR